MRNKIRIMNIEMKNFKNVEYGSLAFGRKEHFLQGIGDLLGIYGQNGSGKTAIIDALDIMQHILTGRALPAHSEDCIRRGSDTAEVTVVFGAKNERDFFEIEYCYRLGVSDGACRVSYEKLSYKSAGQSEPVRKKTLFECRITDDGDGYAPAVAYHQLMKVNKRAFIDFAVAKKMAVAIGTSLLFSKEGYALFSKNYIDDNLSKCLKAMHYFAMMRLFIITNRMTGFINMQLVIPLNISSKSTNHSGKGTIPVSLQDTSVIPAYLYDILQQSIALTNPVLSALIPGLTVDIKDYGEQLTDDGAKGRKIELVSVRGDVCIPLRCESSGIIKIISILNAMIAMYNDEAICIAIDELDSGIFEYLLGNMVQILKKNSRGQLLFTSHNLRALETIDKDSVIFTTANPKNRYARLINIKETNNIRDTYLRCLAIGGQKERMCEDIDIYAIRRAFHLAGKGFDYGN